MGLSIALGELPKEALGHVSIFKEREERSHPLNRFKETEEGKNKAVF